MLVDMDTLAVPERWRLRYADRYCYLGGSSSKTTNQTTMDPMQSQLLANNYQTAQGNAASLTPYTGQLTAGFTPTQTQAQGILSNVATDPTYTANANNASGAAQGVLAAGNPLSAANLQQYMNPYTSDVINASVNQNERARQIANVNDNQQATAAGAFGGSRSGVANALTNQLYDQNDQTNIANLNSANFTQAQQAALNSGNFTLNAANTAANLNNSALQTAATQGGILASVGDAQQQQSQTELTNAYNAYVQGQQLTVQQQQLLNSALGLYPNLSTTSSTQTTSPGALGILGGVASLGLGIGSLGSSIILGKALS